MKKAKVFFIVIALFALVLLVQPFLKAHFAFSENVSDSTGDYIAYGQSCPTGCTDECSYYGQKTCSGDSDYKICGNYDCDTCLEWSSAVNCGTGKICQNGNCVTPPPTCTDDCSYSGQTANQCSGNYVQKRTCGNYDSDSCLEWSGWTNLQDCGTDSWTNNYQCSGNWTQRQKHLKGCSNDSCYDSYQWINEYNCANDGKVCSNGQCVNQCTSHNYKQCSDNDVYWYNSCNAQEDKYQECGSDSWTNNYQCSGDWVQRQKTLKGCSGSSCYTNTQWINYTNCSTQGKICQNGNCVTPPPTCTDDCSYSGQTANQCSGNYVQKRTCGNYDSDSCLEWSGWTNLQDCGTDSWTNNYQCSGNWTQRQKHLKGCSNDSCYDSYQWINEYNCANDGKVCSNGQCVTTCQCNNWNTWVNQGCAQDGCSSGQMYQTRVRTCNPNNCDTQFESKCVSDSSCNQPTCQDECAVAGQTTCNDSGSRKICGNYDSDSCLEWSSPESCGTDTCIGSTRRDYYCSGGTCLYNDSICSSQCYSCGNGVCNSECGETQYNCSQDCGQSCQSECAYSGQLRCYDSAHKQTCGNYDSDSCLEWSPVESILGTTYCGYGSCNSNQKPSWYCTGGIAEYTCNYDSSCGCSTCNNCNDCNDCNNCYDNQNHKSCYNNDVYWYDSNNSRQDRYEDCGEDYCTSWSSPYCSGDSVYKERTCYDKGCSGSSCFSNSNLQKSFVTKCASDEACSNGKCVKEQECTAGPCCDGQNYKSSSTVCKSESDTRYGCPWGIGCGADAGQSARIRFRYCSGDSAQCDGNWGSWGNWSSWIVSDYCSSNETCSVGDSTCNDNSTCSASPIIQTRQCYDNDVYWYNSSGARLSKYMDCEDNNSCTLDRCDAGRCYHDLKCDGTTCSNDSVNYCSSCEHCGDGAVNCNETFCECPVDVKLPIADTVAVSVLAKKSGPGMDEGWKKTLSTEPGEKLSFLIIVASSGSASVPDVKLENILPTNLDYSGNLKVDGSPFVGNILAGLNLGTLGPKQSKYISFDAKIGTASEFISGTTYLSNLSNVAYGEGKVTSDSVSIEVLKGIEGAAAAGTIFSQVVKIIGSLAFWLVILFIVILGAILVFTGYYWMKKKKEVGMVRL